MIIFNLGNINAAIQATAALANLTGVNGLSTGTFNTSMGNSALNSIQQQIYFGANTDFLWVLHKWDDMIHTVT